MISAPALVTSFISQLNVMNEWVFIMYLVLRRNPFELLEWMATSGAITFEGVAVVRRKSTNLRSSLLDDVSTLHHVYYSYIDILHGQ